MGQSLGKLFIFCAFSLAVGAPAAASPAAVATVRPAPPAIAAPLVTLRQRLAEEPHLKLQIWQWPRDLNSLIPLTEALLKENHYGQRQIDQRATVLNVLDVLLQQIDQATPAAPDRPKPGLARTEVLLEFSGNDGRPRFTVRLEQGLKAGAGSWLQFEGAGDRSASPPLYVKNFDALIGALTATP